jgi:hypothetical protein
MRLRSALYLLSAIIFGACSMTRLARYSFDDGVVYIFFIVSFFQCLAFTGEISNKRKEDEKEGENK